MRKFLRQYLPKPLYLSLQSLHSRRKKSLSQLGQDFWVFGEVFNEKRGGYFVEIGSADGITWSNTFLLEKKYDWRGICIEANPNLFADLRRLRSATCVNACVDSEKRQVNFVLKGLGSGIVDLDVDNRPAASRAKAEVVRMETRNLRSILEEEGAPRVVDYLSIDAEGAEERILRDFPMDEYQFQCLTIERPGPFLRDLLNKNEYLMVKEMPDLDSFYIHASFRETYLKNIPAFWSRYRNS